MINKYLKPALIILWAVFLVPALLKAEVTSVAIAGISVKKGQIIYLEEKHLVNNALEILGQADSNAIAVEISLDAGRSWDKVESVNPWNYSFEPEDGQEYTILLHAKDNAGNLSANFIFILKYNTGRLKEVFETIFKNMRDVYIEERLYEFLEFFDPENYPNFLTFKERMENSFDQSSNFNLKITIRNVGLEGDTALLRLDWIKTYEEASRDTGVNNIIRFHKVDGKWKIFDIEDEKIFVVGSGTFKGNITDR